jgi:hypothetical protein
MERVFEQRAIDRHCFEQSFRLRDFLVQPHRVGEHERVYALRKSGVFRCTVRHRKVCLGVKTANFLVYFFDIRQLLLRNPVPGKRPRGGREVPEYRDVLGRRLCMAAQTQCAADTLNVRGCVVEWVEEVNTSQSVYRKSLVVSFCREYNFYVVAIDVIFPFHNVLHGVEVLFGDFYDFLVERVASALVEHETLAGGCHGSHVSWGHRGVADAHQRRHECVNRRLVHGVYVLLALHG